ncbi:DUF1842 domain-containing protein [Abyssisolibacter fermentans]|uniref:DUF1842 domain-containing protein n=1 Tax=Abyssisolibacter fermentans TaxID=1766203 RepID=UPI000836418F|nr:DUF1842 domain-containing protein [Abyssisolibacter fermentans]
MKIKSKKELGLFRVCYEIGGDKPGAPLFRIDFSVYTPEETMSGIGHITQATNPPLNIGSDIHGQYTYMCVMPDKCHILITATGNPIIKWPKHGGVGPILPTNIELKMVVTEDWKSGTANYKYIDAEGNWHEVTDAPVKSVPGQNI